MKEIKGKRRIMQKSISRFDVIHEIDVLKGNMLKGPRQ